MYFTTEYYEKKKNTKMKNKSFVHSEKKKKIIKCSTPTVSSMTFFPIVKTKKKKNHMCFISFELINLLKF